MLRVSLKIQSSPKCKARGNFRRAAYVLYASKKIPEQRSSWDEIWVFRDTLKPFGKTRNKSSIAKPKHNTLSDPHFSFVPRTSRRAGMPVSGAISMPKSGFE